jgi:hypothetical protein
MPSSHRKNRSSFWELIVLPTLAPQLAHPYRVPGTDKVYNTEFGSNSGRHPGRAVRQAHRRHAANIPRMPSYFSLLVTVVDFGLYFRYVQKQ